MIGKKIFHFEILEEIGSGGMGVVYKAKDTKLDRLVALKFLGNNLTDDEESRARFLNEARTISNLDHPNIATVHAIEEFEDTIFICLGYYEGETLKEFLDRDYTFSTEEVFSIIEQIALGLEEAHNTGIIHRDVKPANIFLTRNKQVKILDFGLSKMQKSSVELTQPNVVMGTASYMAPEQIVGEKVSSQSDLFSFGCVMYEIVTGTKPFPGDSALSVSYSIMNSQPEPIQNTRKDIPAELESIIQKALEKRPESRYQSATEILADLDEIKDARDGNGAVSRKVGLQNRVLTLAAILIIAGFFIFNKITNVTTEAASIVVLPFHEETMPEDWNWVSPVLTDLVISHLGKEGDIRVLNSQQEDKILKSLKLKNKKLTKENALQIAQKAKMQSVLMGTIRKENNQIQLSAQLLDSETGNSITNYENIKTEPAQLAGLASNFSSMVRQSFNLQEKEKKNSKNPHSQKAISLDAYRYYIEGKDAAFDLRHKESIEKLSKAIQIDSTFIKAYFHLSHEYARIGENEKAKEILSKGKPYLNDLSEIERLEYLSNKASFDSRWQNYATYMEKLKKLNPHDPSIFYRYGWVQYKKFNQLDAGCEAMETALQIDSTYSPAYNSLAYAYLRNGKPEDAMQIIDLFIKKNPMDIRPRDTKAEFLMLSGHYEKALLECENILISRPDFITTPILVARILNRQGKFYKALRKIESYIANKPSAAYRSEALTVKASILYQTNEFLNAETVIKQAIKIDSTNFEAYSIHGLILLKQNRIFDFENTIERLEHYQARVGGFDGRWFFYYLKGEFAELKEDYNEAINQYSNAIKVNPKDRSFHLTALAKAYQKNQLQKQAISTFTKALEFNSSNALANFHLAKSYEKELEPQQAIKKYEHFLKIWSDNNSNSQEILYAKNRLQALNSTQRTMKGGD